MSEDKTYRIVSFDVSNFKRLEWLRLEPEADELTVIGGANRQGKTSTLDAIEVLFGGKDAVPSEPIRHGARRMKIRGELAAGATVDLVIEVEVDAQGGRKLSVLDEDNKPIRRPQEFLNSLFSRISFDPLAFAREPDPKKQDAMLKKLVGLDFSDLEQRRKLAYDGRTTKNAKVKEFAARLKAMPQHVGVPDQEESISDLLAELERRQGTERKAEDLRREAESWAAAAASDEVRVADQKRKIQEFERQLIDARDALVQIEAHARKNAQMAEVAQRALEAHVVEDTTETRQRLATVQDSNQKVREKAKRAELAAELRSIEDDVQTLTDIIADVDAEQAARIAAAQFPVPGLGFDECGVTFNGVPFDQASHSDRITVSTAIAAALNPKLRVLLIRDGEKIGSEDMATLRRIAREGHFQVFIEKFTETGEGCDVVLEAGRVKTSVAAE